MKRSTIVTRPFYKRDTRLIVIACEGQSEESVYFGLFKSSRYKIVIADQDHGGKSAPQHVLDRLKKWKTEFYSPIKNSGDQFWIVIDCDHNFEPGKKSGTTYDVINEARRAKINVAISNPCFGLWKLLHFQELPPRSLTNENVHKALTVHGASNKAKINPAHFTLETVNIAIERASTAPAACLPAPGPVHVRDQSLQAGRPIRRNIA